eukprot:TRINITY_DN4596_c0_g1_i1.p1 TRINITY_DN4596_c0_g1~~TRINITY_DN4596_c0_g1_i1.p1  ORF type:complete len:457 (+),score=162.18 TRINITY_DN4596_c0_g1_i1:1-1371(+)
MAFWGIEVKSGKPYTLTPDSYDNCRLHLTQATLGLGSSKQKDESSPVVVQCNVGDRPGVLICCLSPKTNASCNLNLMFDEDEDVLFSVLGQTSVHLAGYLMPITEGNNEDEEPGEDLGSTDTESEEYSDEEFSDEELSDDDFIDDNEEEDDVPMLVPNKGVKIEEIEDEEPPKKLTKADRKKKKETEPKSKKKDNELESKEPESKKKDNEPESKRSNASEKEADESEDEDGFPLPAKRKKANDYDTAPPKKKQMMNVDDKGETEAAEPASNKGETEAAEAASNGAVDKHVEGDAPKEKKKSKKKKNKSKEKNKENNTGTNNTTNGEIKEVSEEKPVQSEAETIRSFPNGLVVETLSLGKPDGKKATPGKKISMYYTGRLQKNGKIFDSNVGRKPFQFRLGIGEVISGWDIGVKGMRVGDKRKLTIPPELGYGVKGAPPSIPGNAWLVFDVELVDVK